MRTFHLRIYEADNPFYEGDVESIVVPDINGRYGVLAGHQNMAIAIMEGEIKFHTGSETTYGSGIRGIRELSPDTDYFAAVASGMMRIEDNDVLILVDSAEWPDEIDEERAIQRAEEAREIILQKRSITEYALAEATLRRSIARQRLKQRNI